MLCDVCTCAEYAHVLPAQAWIQEIPELSGDAHKEAIPQPSGDAQNHDESSYKSLQLWEPTQHSSTQISEQLARPWRSEANEDMQEQQRMYVRNIIRIKRQLLVYFTDSNDEIKDKRLPKYKILFQKLWRLFLESRENNTNIEETGEIYEIIHELCEYVQVDQFDEYTMTCVAAHYAFILLRESRSKECIPFLFLRFLLQLCNSSDAKTSSETLRKRNGSFPSVKSDSPNSPGSPRGAQTPVLGISNKRLQGLPGAFLTPKRPPDTTEHNVLDFISQYKEEDDLCYNRDISATEQQLFMVNYIERCVLMLELFDRLLEFYTLKYTSVEKLRKSWRDTLFAYSDYKKKPLSLDFYDFFSGHANHDIMEIVGTTVDAQSVQALLESHDFATAVERIVLPLLSARKSKLTLEVHDDLSNACALQQNWEALNKVLTQLETAGGQAQDEGRRMLQESVKDYESKLHRLVTKICKQYIQMQDVQVLSKQLDRLLKSNTHLAASEFLPSVLKKMKGRVSKLTSRHITQSKQKKTAQTFKHVPESMRQEADNDQEEFNTVERLLARLRTFCTVTLDEKSIGALDTLWHDIQQEFEKLNLLRGHVGRFFHEKNADIPVSVDQVYYFMTSLTFEQAVKHIGLVKLVEARIRQPTQRQSTQLAQAVRCTGYLHEQHALEKELLAAQVAAESESYTAIQNVVRGEEARLIGALEQLYEDRQVLPRLLEELKSLLQTHASAAKRGPTGTSPELTGARDLA